MEFDELKKIWDMQNNKPLYALNEAALHRRIRAKLNCARRHSNTNEIGLMIIAGLATIILMIIGSRQLFSYLTILGLLFTGLYVFRARTRRKQEEHHFDQSMLGELKLAIANVDYQIASLKTFVWWYILPIAVPSFLNMWQSGEKPWWQWVFVSVSFMVSYLVVRWSLLHQHVPRKRALETLRHTLESEVERR